MRRQNVKGAFVADADAFRQGTPETVLLLDDVMTTGNTLSACAVALKESGVKKVVFLCVCAGEGQN